MRLLLPAIAALSFSACAPVTMSPMAIRMGPSDMKGVNASFGLRSGPRLSSPVATPLAGAGTGTFVGDGATFNLAQWAPAYDLSISRGITDTTAIHFGGQGEVYYPFPLPAYGLYAGVSQYHTWGRFALGPAFTLRGATDFGIGAIGGPGTIAGAELACSVGVADEKAPFAIVPFYGLHAVLAGGGITPSHYVGAAVAMRAHYRSVYFEVSGGFGRVFQPNVANWNAPIIGLRVGH